MKKFFAPIAMAGMITLSSCSVSTSNNIDVDASKIKYVQDKRTGLCYAFTASRKPLNASTTGLGMACVPCSEKVMELIKD